MMPKAIYFIHRVGPDGPARDANIESAKLWIRFLVDVLPECAINAPWLAYVMSLDETRYRDRGLRDGVTLAIADVNDIGIVCGPTMSDGCRGDRDNLIEAGRGVFDLTPLGLASPPYPSDEAVALITSGVRAVHERSRRRLGPGAHPQRLAVAIPSNGGAPSWAFVDHAAAGVRMP
jgi:hypothetical protein